MKRKVLHLMLSASLLLGLGGCGNELLTPGQEKPTPEVPAPDENGMVTLRIDVSNSGYRDGVPESRGSEAPVTFTQELGDGYVLESTLTSSPRTRAAGDRLGAGVKIMMFTLDGENKATGYELLEVGENGVLTLSVPAGVTPKLLFYTQNNEVGYGPLQIANILDDVTDIPTTATVGQYYPLSPAVDLDDGGDISNLAPISGSGNKLVSEGMIAIAGPIDTGDPDAPIPPVIFYHAFSRLTWNIVVDELADETIGLVRAGFYPRSTSGTMRFKSYVDGIVSLSELYEPDLVLATDASGASSYVNGIESYNSPAENTFVTPDDWLATDEFSQSVCFLRPAVWNTSSHVATIAIGSLTINNPTGNVTYKDQKITLSGLGNMGFEAGKEYTVNSRITKRLTWATSNIYWDGTKLTFTADAANGGVQDGIPTVTTEDSPYYQGLFFRWGSLTGISPVGDDFGAMTVYEPTSYPNTGYNSSYQVATADWDDITPYPTNMEARLPNPAMQISGTWHGDICSYITNGAWRVPKYEESYNALSYPFITGFYEPEEEGFWTKGWQTEVEWPDVVVPEGPVGDAGKFLIHKELDYALKLKTKWGQTISIPPSGERGRLPGSSDPTQLSINEVGYGGGFWTNLKVYQTVAAGNGGRYLHMLYGWYEKGNRRRIAVDTDNQAPGRAVPIRCVK
jgi:hypothetical protein